MSSLLANDKWSRQAHLSQPFTRHSDRRTMRVTFFMPSERAEMQRRDRLGDTQVGSVLLVHRIGRGGHLVCLMRASFLSVVCCPFTSENKYVRKVSLTRAKLHKTAPKHKKASRTNPSKVSLRKLLAKFSPKRSPKT